MTNTISVTIPLTVSALTRTAEYFRELAADIDSREPVVKAQNEWIDNTVGKIAATIVPPVSTTFTPGETTFTPGELNALTLPTNADDEDDDDTPTPLPYGSEPGVLVDIHRLPWDARIHAGSAAKNKDGSWRQRKNIDKAVVLSVEAELRQVMAIPTPSVPMIIAPADAVPAINAQFAPVPPAPSVPVVPVAPAAPVAAVGGAYPLQYADWPTFMSNFVQDIVAKNRMPMADFIEIIKGFGFPSIPLLKNKPELWPAVAQAVNDKLAGKS